MSWRRDLQPEVPLIQRGLSPRPNEDGDMKGSWAVNFKVILGDLHWWWKYTTSVRCHWNGCTIGMSRAEKKKSPSARSDRQKLHLFRMIQAKALERKHRGLTPQVLVGIVRISFAKSRVLASYQEPVKRRRYPEHCAEIIHFGSQREDCALPGRKCRLCTSWSGWDEF